MTKISLCRTDEQCKLILKAVEEVTRGLNNHGEFGQAVELEVTEAEELK